MAVRRFNFILDPFLQRVGYVEEIELSTVANNKNKKYFSTKHPPFASLTDINMG